MEVAGVADSRKKLNLRKRERDHEAVAKVEDITALDDDFVESQKEKWQQVLLQIEQRRNDLLLEHEKMQKMSQKIQSLQVFNSYCVRHD